MKATIDLQHHRTPNSKVFTGRDRGEEVRNASRIDDLEGKHEEIEIIIPEDIWSINPSFLEEFLYNVVKKIGKEAFYKKFHFINPGQYKINEDLEAAIDRILRTRNALL